MEMLIMMRILLHFYVSFLSSFNEKKAFIRLKEQIFDFKSRLTHFLGFQTNNVNKTMILSKLVEGCLQSFCIKYYIDHRRSPDEEMHVILSEYNEFKTRLVQ